MSAPGYYRHPTVHGGTVVFASEEDLWTVPLAGGVARRLTSGLGQAVHPAFSPDGRWIAFSGSEEGHLEIFVMPAEGGEARRLTFLGEWSRVTGWDPRGRIVFTSNAGPLREAHLFTLPPSGGAPEPIPVGPARSIAFGPGRARVIARHGNEPAYWKRYRGGMAGELWIDPDGRGRFRRLAGTMGNPTRPFWMGRRVFFVSDHEGVGNLYSCDPKGGGLRRETHHRDFYVRTPSSDGRRVVYHAGADLYLYEPDAGPARKIDVRYHSPRTQRNRKFVRFARHWEAVAPSPKGQLVALAARGRVFVMGPWDGAVHPAWAADGVRHRLGAWLNDGKRLLLVSDEAGEERLEIHPAQGGGRPRRLERLDAGRPGWIVMHPRRDEALVTNHRNELLWVDLKQGRRRVLDRSAFGSIRGVSWSPDGRWAAYGFAVSRHVTVIRLVRVAGGKPVEVTRPVLGDFDPVFDPEGKYLYFISAREFNPVYDGMHFALGFPLGTRPYLVTLRRDVPSPFVHVPKDPAEAAPEKPKSKKPAKAEPLRMDLEGIADRVLAFPVPEARYYQLGALKGKVLFAHWPPEGSLDAPWWPGDSASKGVLEMYDLGERKTETLFGGIDSYALSADRAWMAYRAGESLRVVKAGEKFDESQAGKGHTKKSGWVDLNRLRVPVTPPAEWRQMYREAWRLQRDYFWSPDMSRVDWRSVYRRYLPLLDRVSTRTELTDLLWEMQGELGTSHAYVFGGDERRGPHFGVGKLGADLAWSAGRRAWRIAKLYRGDPWLEWDSSPLARAGVGAREGDLLLAIGGRKLTREWTPGRALVDQAGREVAVTLAGPDGRHERTVSVKTLYSEYDARYRDWVETNRARVHKETGGRVGYLHIPDMGPRGYAEFHRAFLAESDRDGLIVDVRFNGGGHVSQLLLEKLARKRIAWVKSRWQGVEPYPSDSPAGPMVALTNQYAGSDGDIFSHGFKLMKLGPLIGKRTWGGVIGISVQNGLVDGGLTTQPEYSFWFKDVGWKVENYGTDPDIEVDVTPEDHAAGRDPQLDRGLEEIVKRMKAHPPAAPSFGRGPDLALPLLPRRGKTR